MPEFNLELEEQELNQIVDLSKRLPVKNEAKIFNRLLHAKWHGHLVIMREEGKVVGYAECYQLKAIPSYPVEPLPKNERGGKYLYVWAASCEKGYARKGLNVLKNNFPNCDFIIYHRFKRNNKLKIERI